MEVTLQDFLLQLAKGIENPNDTIRSIGCWCGSTAPAKYTVYARRADGTEYEIHIKNIQEVK